MTDNDVQEALAHEIARERQPDGRLRIWGRSSAHSRPLRIVLLEDGVTVHNAFPDRSFGRHSRS